MTTRTPPSQPVETLAELMERLGDVPLSRVRMQPPPGTATEEHLVGSGKKLLELVEGVLVEKAVGTREALLGGLLCHLFWDYLEVHKLGKALPGDAWLRLMPGLVRVPDVAFISWDRMPGR